MPSHNTDTVNCFIFDKHLISDFLRHKDDIEQLWQQIELIDPRQVDERPGIGYHSHDASARCFASAIDCRSIS
jgi:hypothetical protein